MSNLANKTSTLFGSRNRENMKDFRPVHFGRTDGETKGGHTELTFDTTAWSA